MDLFEPGTGSKVHDYTGGILASGLVWTVPIADDTIVVSRGGKQLDVDVRDVPVMDATPVVLPATVSFRMTWRGKGVARRLGRGNAVGPTDPAAFLGRFLRAHATGTFSGTTGAFTFQSSPQRLARSVFAELGTEQTGLLATAARCAACALSAPLDSGSLPRW